jgi:glycosyltransferase involved in cell wall biosynthesis
LWNLKGEDYKGVSFEYVPFLNFLMFKHFSVFAFTFFKVICWCIQNRKEDKIVICDILNNGIVWSTFIACKLIGQKMLVLVTDLPEMMVRSEDNQKTLKKAVIALSMYVLHRFDYYVILTEQMNEIVNPKKKPFLVMEGLVDGEIEMSDNKLPFKKQKRIFLYAGGIYEKYGVKKLIEAFMLLEADDLELHIYGSGDLEKQMVSFCQKDNRIKYFGVVSNNVVVDRLKEATLLINPRPITERFTKYSFPSKNMEYMVSGTPLLTTKLPGMPKEYNKFVFLIDDESVNGISEKLDLLLSNQMDEFEDMGMKAKRFVLDYKSNKMQAKNIIDLLNT